MKLTGRGRNTFKGIYYDAFKDSFYYLEILIQHRKFFKQTCKGHKSPIKFFKTTSFDRFSAGYFISASYTNSLLACNQLI